MSFSVSLVQGIRTSARRGIAFLESDDEGDVNAKRVFVALKPNKKRDVLGRFDYWIDGGICDKYFHGWPSDPERKNCFVFKWKNGHTHHRMYGFLCHPKNSDLSFQACVLVVHGQKNEEHTNPVMINLVKRQMECSDVLNAVRKAFQIDQIV